MNVRIATCLLAASAATVLPACTTVNMADVAVPGARAEAPAEVNIVQRAVEKLKTAFTQRGFGPKDGREKMQAAANILLNGINSEAAQADNGYAAVDRSPAIVAADILVATRHVEQTARAAEVYLEIVPADRSVEPELAELEAALLVSERAARGFAAALDDEGDRDLAALRDSVDRLRRVTDGFGFRARQDRMAATSEATG